MAKETFEGQEFRTHNGLFVPQNTWRELHPTKAKLEDAVDTAKGAVAVVPYILAGAAALVVLAGQPNMAHATEPEAKPTPSHEVFAGTIVTEAGTDTIATYQHESGLSTNLELFNRMWTPEAELGGDPAHALDFGIRSPKFLDELLRGNATVSTNIVSLDDWRYTAFLEAFPVEGLTLRSGLLHDGVTEAVGGFLGGKFATPHLTIDLDTFYDGDQAGNPVGLHGFLAGNIPTKAGNLYLSVGGDLDSEVINTLTGWINPGGVGVFNRVSVDLENKAQSGQLLVANQSTYTKEKFDFKQHIYNATQMRSHGTQILDGWAPFTANYTKGFALAGSWDNSPETAGFELMAYLVPTEGVFLGIGAGDKIVKAVEEHQPFARAELYAKILGPLEAWGSVPIDLQTGEMKGIELYIGGAGSF